METPAAASIISIDRFTLNERLDEINVQQVAYNEGRGDLGEYLGRWSRDRERGGANGRRGGAVRLLVT